VNSDQTLLSPFFFLEEKGDDKVRRPRPSLVKLRSSEAMEFLVVICRLGMVIYRRARCLLGLFSSSARETPSLLRMFPIRRTSCLPDFGPLLLTLDC